MLDLGAPAMEHVVGLQHGDVVDEDLGDRVDAVEFEVDDVVRQQRRVHLERAFEDPVAFADPLHLGGVVADAGIGDEARLHERGVDAAGDDDVEAGDGVEPLRGQPPDAREIKNPH